MGFRLKGEMKEEREGRTDRGEEWREGRRWDQIGLKGEIKEGGKEGERREKK